MNLFPRTPDVRMPSLPKPKGMSLPKVGIANSNLGVQKSSMPSIAQPKVPKTPNFKNVNTGNLMGPTASQKSVTSQFKLAKAPKIAVMKGAIKNIIPKSI